MPSFNAHLQAASLPSHATHAPRHLAVAAQRRNAAIFVNVPPKIRRSVRVRTQQFLRVVRYRTIAARCSAARNEAGERQRVDESI